MDLRSLLNAVQIAGVLAFLSLTVHLLRSGRFLSLPFFTSYCALMVVDLIWHPTKLTQAMWIQPWILSLEACSVIEAAGLAVDQIRGDQRRYLLLCLACVGVMIGSRAAGFYPLVDLGGWYRTLTQGSRLTLAGWLFAMVIYQWLNRESARWDWLWVPHLRILAAYMIMRGGWSFLARPGMGWETHSQIRIAWLLAVCGWAAVYLWYDRRELRAPRLHRADSARSMLHFLE